MTPELYVCWKREVGGVIETMEMGGKKKELTLKDCQEKKREKLKRFNQNSTWNYVIRRECYCTGGQYFRKQGLWAKDDSWGLVIKIKRSYRQKEGLMSLAHKWRNTVLSYWPVDEEHLITRLCFASPFPLWPQLGLFYAPKEVHRHVKWFSKSCRL